MENEEAGFSVLLIVRKDSVNKEIFLDLGSTQGIIKGRKATSFSSIATDVKNAGAHYEDSEVVADQGIVTSRSPEDLDAFVAKIVEEIEEGKHDRKAA